MNGCIPLQIEISWLWSLLLLHIKLQIQNNEEIFRFRGIKEVSISHWFREDCFYWIAYPPTVSLCVFIINESCILFGALLYYILPGLDWPGGGLTCKWTTIFKNGVAILALLFPFSQFSLCLHRINFDARGGVGEGRGRKLGDRGTQEEIHWKSAHVQLQR